ncbi:cold shock domain-containing protein [Paenibacillus sp. S-12]|uniref:cold-shock protein n=1 Tax=Paenibacillus sp. S-12 TaxID=3031371 RepID=UPI0025A0522D|nr:cold shock domain-containing protein [Paenibacillus sp. S-12]
MKTKGTVKWFSVKKGYGFVTGEDGQDAFVHWSNIKMDGFKALNDGVSVEYRLEPSDKGMIAKDISLVEEA